MTAPRQLVVVGAAAGMGRWLHQHLFSTLDVERLVLVDRRLDAGFAELADERTTVTDLDGLDPSVLSTPGTALCLAVPRAGVRDLAQRLLPEMADDAIVFDISSAMRSALDDMHAAAKPGQIVFGSHPLFSPLVRTMDGQTIVVAPPAEGDISWFVDAVNAAGGIVKHVDPDRHDDVMAYVETLAQQTLLGFADAVEEFIAAHDRVYVVEQNRDGQMLSLLRNEIPQIASKLRSVRHYDGMPVPARAIVTGILSQEETA